MSQPCRRYDCLRVLATAVALCADADVTGAPFYLTDWVEGLVVDCPAAVAGALASNQSRQTAANHLIDVLGMLHRLDVDQVGLGCS